MHCIKENYNPNLFWNSKPQSVNTSTHKNTKEPKISKFKVEQRKPKEDKNQWKTKINQPSDREKQLLQKINELLQMQNELKKSLRTQINEQSSQKTSQVGPDLTLQKYLLGQKSIVEDEASKRELVQIASLIFQLRGEERVILKCQEKQLLSLIKENLIKMKQSKCQ